MDKNKGLSSRSMIVKLKMRIASYTKEQFLNATNIVPREHFKVWNRFSSQKFCDNEIKLYLGENGSVENSITELRRDIANKIKTQNIVKKNKKETDKTVGIPKEWVSIEMGSIEKKKPFSYKYNKPYIRVCKRYEKLIFSSKFRKNNSIFMGEKFKLFLSEKNNKLFMIFGTEDGYKITVSNRNHSCYSAGLTKYLSSFYNSNNFLIHPVPVVHGGVECFELQFVKEL